MITADSLNLDVLEQIFSFLSERDLPSIALVNRSFSASVVSRLYKTISYHLRHSKGYTNGETMSPFAVIISHPCLAVYVRYIDICTVPHIKSLPHPVFMQECRDALQQCKNLTTFKYSTAVPNLVSTLIPSLLNKPRLKDLRINCSISTPAAKILVKIKNLSNLSLEFASWNIAQILPSWVSCISATLNTLTLYMINDLREDILRDALQSLPNLRGLHVVGCSKLNHSVVLNHVVHTPLLESLSMTTTPHDSPIPDFIFSPTPPLRHLKHLALDTKFTMQSHPAPSAFITVLTLLKPSSPSLVSFALKMPEKKLAVSEELVTQLIENHSCSLRRLAFIDCIVGRESIEKICKSCIHLEELALSVPTKDLLPFAQGLAQSKTLRTVIDLEAHVEHGIRTPIDRDSARYLMSLSTSLRKVITTTDVWMGKMLEGFVMVLPREKRFAYDPTPLWFTPQSEITQVQDIQPVWY